MKNVTALSLSLIGGVAGIAYFVRPLRLVRVNGVCSSLYWTIRSWLWNYPITANFDAWTISGRELEDFNRDRLRFISMWSFLPPFFASKGYYLHVQADPSDMFSDLIPCHTSARRTEQPEYPFARCFYETDRDASFMFYAPRVWPARDHRGREVVIKAISGPSPTNELQVLRILSSEPLRNDPKNPCIPVIEFLTFSEQVFVVMPRWDEAFDADFVKVKELVDFGWGAFEAIAFLHKHGITHGDFIAQNFCVDVLVPGSRGTMFAGIRGPECRYALIDFGAAKLGRSSSSDEMDVARRKDVFDLADSMGVNLRCIEDVVPQLGVLLDSMMDANTPPTASAALARYEDICSSLTVEDLERDVQMTFNNSQGFIRYREGPPVYFASKM